MHGNKHMGEICKGWIMDMSEMKDIENMARAAHDALPDVVVWLKELADRIDTLERYLERAEYRHVRHAREQIADLYRKHMGTEIDQGNLEVAAQYWTRGSKTMRELEAEILEGRGKKEEPGTPGINAGWMRSMWLADYDPARQLATWTTLTLMAQPTDTARHAIINRVVKYGGKQILLYAVNWGDFAHTQYREVFYDSSKKAEWLEWFQHIIAMNLEIVMVMRNDDATHPRIGTKLNDWKAYWDRLIRDVLEPLGIRHIILGLEALEYLTIDEANELGSWLKERCPWARIGHHTMPGDTRLCGAPWVDDIYFQGPFWRTPEANVGDYLALIRDFPEKRVIMMEYSMQQDTQEAADIGNALIAAGCKNVLGGFGQRENPGYIHEPQPPNAQWRAKPANAPWDIGSGIKSLGPVDAGAIHWKQTIALKGVEIFGGKIRFPYSKNTPWMQAKQPDGSTSTGNLWCVQNVRGQLYATTIDWLRNPDQQSKDFPGVMQAPGHLLAPMDFRPGESYGFFVSTCARNDLRTTNERSNIVWIRIDNSPE